MGRLHQVRLSTLINLCHPVSWDVFIRYDSPHWSTSVTPCHGTSSSGTTLYTNHFTNEVTTPWKERGHWGQDRSVSLQGENDLAHSVFLALHLHLCFKFQLSVRGSCDRYSSVWSLPPTNEVCEDYVFTPVCDSIHRGVCIWDVCIQGGGWAELPPHQLDTTEYGQWAGGTHPTGMHSCLLWFHRWTCEYHIPKVTVQRRL